MEQLPVDLENRLLDFLAGDSTYPWNLASSCKHWRASCARYKRTWHKGRAIIKIDATSDQTVPGGTRKIRDVKYILASQNAEEIEFQTPLAKDWAVESNNFRFKLSFETRDRLFWVDSQYLDDHEWDENSVYWIHDIFHIPVEGGDLGVDVSFKAFTNEVAQIRFARWENRQVEVCTMKNVLDLI